MGPASSAASDSAAYFVITIVRLPEQIRSSAVRAAPWISYRRGIDLGWQPIESSRSRRSGHRPSQADVELDVLFAPYGKGLRHPASVGRDQRRC